MRGPSDGRRETEDREAATLAPGRRDENDRASDELRRHDPDEWPGFQPRYRAELDAHPEVWRPLLEAARHGKLTLYYGARDTEHNNAVVLREYLETKLGKH